MNKASLLLVLAAACSLSACALTPGFPLVRSDAADAAKVRIVDKTFGWLALFPPDDCNEGHRITIADPIARPVAALAGFSHNKIEMLAAAADAGPAVAEFSVAPGQVVNLGGLCLAAGSFVARAGTQYEVVVRQFQASRCETEVHVLSLEQGQVLRTPMNELNPMVCKLGL